MPYPPTMGTRARALLATLVVVAVPVATIRLLHGMADRRWFRIDYGNLGEWLRTTDLTDALAAVARLAALALAYYLVVSTLLYLIAVTTGSRGLIRVTRPLALPIVRSLADRVVAGSIAITALATPLIASGPPTPAPADLGISAEVLMDYLPASRIVDAADVTRLPGPDEPTAELEVSYTERPTTPPPEADSESPEPPLPDDVVVAGVTEVVARQGDHLWGLAETRMSQALGRPALDHEVASYWREVVDENRGRIRSGNPDLILPGETILLPDPAPFVPTTN